MIMTGGVWQKTEDEILDTSVTQHVINQWSRIASFLPRKSAEECKMRFFELLFPTIIMERSREWSREEDDTKSNCRCTECSRSHHAEMEFGRTKAQLVDKLFTVNSVEMKEKDDDAADDPRNPGEIDPNPETMPARSDTNYMDELNEMAEDIYNRIFNVREIELNRRMLRRRRIRKERRLAALRKQRRLRAARLTVSQKKKCCKRDANYSTEIPFEKRPAKKHKMKEEDEDAADDPRKLNPREIDPNPETMPARSDPNDTNELEMLSEARARLANTRRKEAKR